MAKDKSRGKNPTNLTILKLCARAAGRCQFEGCNEYLFKDELTQSEFNRSNIAHIVASSPNGPRGDNERSYELSDDIDNLILVFNFFLFNITSLVVKFLITFTPICFNSSIIYSTSKILGTLCKCIFSFVNSVVVRIGRLAFFEPLI